MSQKNTPAATPKVTILSRLLCGTCVRYTVISLVVLLINILFSGDERAYVDPVDFLLFLPFALCLAAATLIRRADSLPTGARATLHPLLAVGGFYLCLYLPYQIAKKPTPGQILAILVLAALIYGITTALILLITRKKRQKKIDDTPYISQFGHKS